MSWGTVAQFTWSDGEKHENPVRIPDFPVKIQTEDYQM
jgi:hypothetical protein